MADITFTNIPSEVEMTHEWKTGIQKAISGQEKLSALFSWPRVKVDQKHTVITATERNFIKNSLFEFASLDKIWAVPLWSDACQLSVNANSGQAVISTVEDPQAMDYLVDRYAVLANISDYTSYEVIEISSIATNEINAKVSLSSTWDKDSTFICPLHDMTLNSTQNELSRTEDEISTIQLRFREAFLATLAHTYVQHAYTPATYAGVDLFPVDISPQKAHNFEFMSNAIVSQKYGMGYAINYFDETEMEIGFRFLLKERTQQFKLRNFFDKQMGRYGHFFIPTFGRDLRLTSAVGVSDTVLNVNQSDDYYSTYFGNTLTGRYIAIFTPSGNYYARKVTAASSSTITITAVGEAIENYQACRISLLHYCRFTDDQLSMQFKGPWIARGNIGVKILQGEPAPS